MDRDGLPLGEILDSAPDAVILMDADGKIAGWNHHAETIFGWPSAEALGKKLDELVVPPRSREGHRQGMQRFLETGERRILGKRMEMQALRRDGSEFTVELTVSAHRWRESWIFSSFIRDISERRRADESLRASEEKFQDFYDNAPDMYLSTRIRTGEIVECNQTCARVLGWSKQEIIGRNIFELYDASCVMEAERSLQLLLKHGEVHDVELQVRRRDGSRISVSSSASAVRDPLGRISRSRVIWRDISERKRLAELRNKSQELIEENRRALEASRLKGEFLANMSHELRTPLNAILGFAELLHDGKVGPLDETQKEFLGDILSSGRHLLTLINDVLDLSKIEAGKMTFRPENLQLSTLIQEVSDILREMVGRKRLRLKTEIDPGLDRVFLDPAKLKQVLYNFLSNAIKFTSEGGTVTMRAKTHGPEHFRLEVEDTGIGIRPEDLPRLFVEFQQLDSSSSKRFAGTGLGLALTKRIVTTQGGEVGVSSTPGEGSIFFAVLPRRDQSEPQ